MPEWYRRFVESIERGEPTYVDCPECGMAELPPRTTCPGCGNPNPEVRPLSRVAEVETFTEILVPIPRFEENVPYTVVVAAFDEGVKLTGQLRETDEVDIGDPVRLGVEEYTDGEKIVTFTPVSS